MNSLGMEWKIVRISLCRSYDGTTINMEREWYRVRKGVLNI